MPEVYENYMVLENVSENHNFFPYEYGNCQLNYNLSLLNKFVKIFF